MPIVKGHFSKLLKVFEDECSPTRHFFAKLGLCKHKGRDISLKYHFDKATKRDFTGIYKRKP